MVEWRERALQGFFVFVIFTTNYGVINPISANVDINRNVVYVDQDHGEIEIDFN